MQKNFQIPKRPEPSSEERSSDDERISTNHIESKLNNLYEETRRKMLNYEQDDESPMSEEQMLSANESQYQTFDEGYMQR